MKTSNKKKKKQFKSFITNKKNIVIFIFLILLIVLSIAVYLKIHKILTKIYLPNSWKIILI